jgi:hypothetical protein
MKTLSIAGVSGALRVPRLPGATPLPGSIRVVAPTSISFSHGMSVNDHKRVYRYLCGETSYKPTSVPEMILA